MNKKTVLMVVAASTALALTTVVLAGLGSKGLWLSADTEPGGSITLDATLLDCPFEEGEFEAQSKKGNSFSFKSKYMTMSDGVFTIEDGGAFWNEDVLNGLYRMEITFTESVALHFNYESSAYGMEEDKIDVTEGLNVIKFNKFDPQRVTLYSTGEALKFSKIVFYYSCVADEPDYDINYAETYSFDGWSVNMNGIFAPVGTALSAIDVSTVRFGTPFGYIFGNEVTDLEITYMEVDSTTVVEGGEPVSISFVYNENAYFGSGIGLLGYDSSELEIEGAYFQSSYFRQQETDDLPEGIIVHVHGAYHLLDKAGESDLATLFVSQELELTEEMVTKLDAEPFTKIGQHNMLITVLGFDANPWYEIYNPEVNNISGIYTYGGLEVDEGTTTDEFLAYIATKTFGISYYEDDKSLPHETTLGAENFTLKGDEFDGSSLQVMVPFTYQTYSGTLYVNVNKAAGELVAEYHNDDGVDFMSGKIYRIGLYDNGVAILYMSKEAEYGSDYAYTLDGTTLTIIIQSTPFLFTIDDEEKTFSSYTSSATLLYTFGVDFSAFGGGSTLYKGEMYDDNTVVFEVAPGMIANCPFTFDPSDNTIIYFNFMGVDSIGTIDYSALTMVVTMA